MARRLLFYTSYEYNRGPIIISSKYLYRPFRYRDTSYKYNRGLVISNKYL